jgi:hypothetical protein
VVQRYVVSQLATRGKVFTLCNNATISTGTSAAESCHYLNMFLAVHMVLTAVPCERIFVLWLGCRVFGTEYNAMLSI